MANYMLLAILLRISNAARRPAREQTSNAPTDTSLFPAVQEASR